MVADHDVATGVVADDLAACIVTVVEDGMWPQGFWKPHWRKDNHQLQLSNGVNASMALV
mgnify:CR=1 FL=1